MWNSLGNACLRAQGEVAGLAPVEWESDEALSVVTLAAGAPGTQAAVAGRC
jgi:hypothetical protein